MHRLNQDVFLRFTGNPKGTDDSFYKGVEAFAEIKGNLTGVASNRLIYGFSARPELVMALMILRLIFRMIVRMTKLTLNLKQV